MDLIASVFDSKSKCYKCKNSFSLLSKRRKCVTCGNTQIGMIFCKKCSTKVSVPGIFTDKRYCKDCHAKGVAGASSRAPPSSRPPPPPPVSNTSEEVKAGLKITEEEYENNKQSIVDVVNTINQGVKAMPRAASVFSI